MIGFDGQLGAWVASLAALAAGLWTLRRDVDVRHPAFIVGLTWTITLATYAASGNAVPSLSLETTLMLGIGPWCFALAARAVPCQEPSPGPGAGEGAGAGAGEAVAPRWVGDLLLALSVAGLPLLVLRLLEVGASGPTSNAFINVRLAAIGGETDPFGALAYLVNLTIFSAGIHALHLVATSRARVAAMLSIALIYCILTTGRTHFTMLLAIVGGGLVVSGRMRVRTFLGIFLALFAVVFLLVGLALGKIVGDDASIASALGQNLFVYLVGGIAAFNDFLKTSEPWTWGENVGRSLLAALHRLGLAREPRALVKEFRMVGLETNVYTVYRPYLEDLGWPGVIAAQAVFGAVSGYVFQRARRPDRVFAFAYGALMYPAVMQVFQDQYFSLLSTWIQAAALLAIVTWASRRSAAETRWGDRPPASPGSTPQGLAGPP